MFYWQYDLNKKDEAKRREEEHLKLASRLIGSAEGDIGLLHKITKPTAWRGGVRILEEEEEDVRPLNGPSTGRATWKV